MTVDDEWRSDAACIQIGPGLFDSKSTRVEAKRFCHDHCTVRQQCLETALRDEGGLHAKDRYLVVGGEYAGTRWKLWLKGRRAA